MEDLPYLAGTRPANPGLLSRFLPPLEEGALSSWLQANIPPGSWLLDPFGASPRMLLEAARAGYRLLVAANNPISRFLIETAASAPSEPELKPALAELAAARKSDERLETHLQSLYLTPCERCGREIPAQLFYWNKGDDAPYARFYECQHCEDSGERPATPIDIERARELGRSANLHRARILERVAPVGNPDREYADEALQVYVPRALYALATLINRVDGLDVNPARRRLITALILAALDAGTSLTPAFLERPRPKQLTVSPAFREYNLWMALEQAVGQWSETGAPVPCEAWPGKIPESGGICLFEGRLKDLASQVQQEIPIAAVIGAVPRPNQAFWTLSALWAGWLWGHEAAKPFMIGLRRRRYDSLWSATALGSTFHHLSSIVPQDTPMLAFLVELESPLATAAFTAAQGSGFDLTGLSMRDELDPLQTVWRRLAASSESFSRDMAPAREAIEAHLNARLEPATYLRLHMAALARLASLHALRLPDETLEDALRNTNTLLEMAVSGDAPLIHYSQGESLEAGIWGLRLYESEQDSLADRVEMSIVRFLQKKPDCIFLEIEEDLYNQFRGLLTPSKGLIYNVLYSYAQRKGGAWRLRQEDAPSSRRQDLQQMAALVEAVGGRLGYTTRQDGPALVWESGGSTERVFYIIASALVGRVVSANLHPPEKCVIVLPGGRASLVAYKQQRDPALAEKMRPWRLLKYRLLRSLAEIPVLNRQTFDEQINSDPVEQAQGQLMMF